MQVGRLYNPPRMWLVGDKGDSTGVPAQLHRVNRVSAPEWISAASK